MNVIELTPTLGEEEIRQIFKISRSCLYRRLKEIKEGKDGGIPPPIPMGATRRRLRWDAEAVRKFCQAQNAPRPPTTIVESSEQTKQLDYALQELEGFGVKLAKPNKRNGQKSCSLR